MVSDVTPTTVPNITAYDEDDGQPQQQDSVVDVTNNNWQTVSDNKPEDDTKQSSPCHFPTNVINMSTAKLAAGTRHVFNTSITL